MLFIKSFVLMYALAHSSEAIIPPILLSTMVSSKGMKKQIILFASGKISFGIKCSKDIICFNWINLSFSEEIISTIGSFHSFFNEFCNSYSIIVVLIVSMIF